VGDPDLLEERFRRRLGVHGKDAFTDLQWQRREAFRSPADAIRHALGINSE
jgi:hypothetical protein